METAGTGSTDAVLADTDHGVLTLTLNRLDKKNAISNAMYAALADALDGAAASAATRVVVIQGHTLVFSAGNDLADFATAPPADRAAPVWRFLRALAAFPKPLIGAVCGAAVGIGTTLLLHCDLVYAGDNAIFSLPFVHLGLCPEAGSSLLLPALFGHQRAAEVLLLGEPFRAETAVEFGLVNRILAPAEVNAFAQTQARKLAAKPADAVLATKRLMKLGRAERTLQRIADEGDVFESLLRAPAAQQALSAFLGQRAERVADGDS